MKSVYLDNAATSFPKPPEVSREMVRYITEIGSNVNRSSYEGAYEAEETVFETRTLLKELFNGPDEKNVVFTSGITMSLNMVIKGLLSAGDHVIICPLPHNAVMRPVRQLEEDGVEVTLADLTASDEGGFLFQVSSLEALLQKNTRAVVMTHGSNVSGMVFPLRETGEFCRKHHLFFIVDSAQTAGAFELDMKADHIDALCFTGHKALMGPQGTGGMILSDRIASVLKPLISGGTGSISHLESIPGFLPDRFEPGTPNLPGIYGLNAALSFIKGKGLTSIRERETSLAELFISEIRNIDGLRIIGHEAGSAYTGVVSVYSEKIDCAQLAASLESDFGIKTRVGLHCSPSAHKSLGTYPGGTVRFSFGFFSTEDEAVYAAEALRRLIGDLC